MAYKLSLKEKKLLSEISLNCRQPLSETARRIGVSKQGTGYLLRKLIRDKIILGFYPVLNVMNLGYYYARFFAKLMNMTEKDERKMMHWLTRNTNWVLKTNGVYDIVLALWSKHFEDFKEMANAFGDKFSDKIESKRESICTELVQFKDRYIYDDGTMQKIAMRKTGTFEPDALDRKILKALDGNARMQTVKIAEKTGASPKKVALRIKKMERENVLLGYRPLLNISLLGYSFYKVFFFFNRFGEDEIKKFKAYLGSRAEVTYLLHEISGPDLDVELILGSDQNFFQFMKNLLYRFPGLIKKYDFILVESQSSISYIPLDL